MKLIWQILGAVLLIGAIGVGSYVGVKKVLRDVLLPDVSAVQREVDEIVSELERAGEHLSGFRDSLDSIETGVSELGRELAKSRESADRLGLRIGASLDRQRELEKLFEESTVISGELADGIGRGEAALLRLRKYLDSNPQESGD